MSLAVLSDDILVLLTKVNVYFKSIVFQGSFIIINYILDLSELPLFYVELVIVL